MGSLQLPKSYQMKTNELFNKGEGLAIPQIATVTRKSEDEIRQILEKHKNK